MAECLLHVYDVTNSPNEDTNATICKINNVTRYVSFGGIFHGGIEVYGEEWSYGYTTRDSGVYFCAPRDNPMYTYRETVPLGKTSLSKAEVAKIIESMKVAWKGLSYDPTANNCNNFCHELAEKLGIEPPPAWVNRMAASAEALYSFGNYTAEQARWLKSSGASWWKWAAGQSTQ